MSRFEYTATEGTGLDDIITKSHSGTLTVETQEGAFTEFAVRLPA